MRVRVGLYTDFGKQQEADKLHVGIRQQPDVGALENVFLAVVAAHDQVQSFVDVVETDLAVEDVRVLDIVGIQVSALGRRAILLLQVGGFPVPVTDNAKHRPGVVDHMVGLERDTVHLTGLLLVGPAVRIAAASPDHVMLVPAAEGVIAAPVGVLADTNGRARHLVAVFVVDGELDVRVIGRRPEHDAPRGEKALVAKIAPIGHGRGGTVALVGEDVTAKGQAVARRNVDHTLHPHQVLVAKACLDEALELIGGFVGYDVDDACGGIATEQRALGPLQYLGTRDICERNGGDGPRHVGAVVKSGHGGILTRADIRAADATDRNAQLGAATLGVANLHPGHEGVDILDRRCAGIDHRASGR